MAGAVGCVEACPTGRCLTRRARLQPPITRTAVAARAKPAFGLRFGLAFRGAPLTTGDADSWFIRGRRGVTTELSASQRCEPVVSVIWGVLRICPRRLDIVTPR